jgi:NAD(P) transhydrogenase
MQRFELCVIGSGPGGQKAAIQASKLGHSVCVVERMEVVGGVAINTGTIPSKAFREAVVRATRNQDADAVRAGFAAGRTTMETMMTSCRRIVAIEIEIVRTQLESNGVKVINGHARFVDKNKVEIESLQNGISALEAENILIASGTLPAKPENVPFDGTNIFTSDDLLGMNLLPKSLIVVGAGVIGAEFASMFSQIGVKVTLVDSSPRILCFLDAQIGEALQFHLRDQGMTLRLGEKIMSIERVAKEHNNVLVRLESGKKVRAESLLYCLGRQGATGDLGLEAIGLKTSKYGKIPVDENFQTTVPGVFAVGDVIGWPSLASTSMDQGRVAASKLFGGPPMDSNRLFPIGIYSIPEISMVGQNEDQLTEAEIPYEFGIAHYRETARGQLIGDEQGMLKILFDTRNLEVLGVHIVGTGATELIHIGQAVMALGGNLEYFTATAFNYPTLAECYKIAALNGFNKMDN